MPKIGRLCPFLGVALSPCNTKSPGLRPSYIRSDILIHVAIWPQQTWAENYELSPFGGVGAGSPSNTMWPEPRPTCVPCFILIRPTVGHSAPTSQTDRINRTDRQTDEQDNGPMAEGEPFYKRSTKKGKNNQCKIATRGM